MNVPFTYLDAIVDVSIAQYRLFAVGPAISRKDYQPSITFAIRIHAGNEKLLPLFLRSTSPWLKLFTFLIARGISMVIAGKTGSGKTQLQKELLTLMPSSSRVIVMDNILELDGLMIPHLDLSIWQVKPNYSIQKLIEGALRSHPDWLLIAESRGEEFKEVLRSVKTGHPIITTLHSDAIQHIYDRMVSMLLIGESMSHAGPLYQEVKTFFPVLIHLQTHGDQEKVIRSIEGVTIQRPHHMIELNANITLADIEEVIKRW
jgi:pilus assembly protein CpaF